MNNATLTAAVHTAIAAIQAHIASPRRAEPMTAEIGTGPALAPNDDALDESAWTLSYDGAQKTITLYGAMGHDVDELAVIRALSLYDVGQRAHRRIEREIREDAERQREAVRENDALA